MLTVAITRPLFTYTTFFFLLFNLWYMIIHLSLFLCIVYICACISFWLISFYLWLVLVFLFSRVYYGLHPYDTVHHNTTRHDILPECLSIITSFVFIELFDYSSCDDLTTLDLSMNHQIRFLNWLPNYHHNPLIRWAVFSPLSLAFMPWHQLNIPPTSCEIWIMTKFLYKKFNYCRLYLMGMSCSNFHQFFWLFIGLHICKAWIEAHW